MIVLESIAMLMLAVALIMYKASIYITVFLIAIYIKNLLKNKKHRAGNSSAIQKKYYKDYNRKYRKIQG